MKKTKLTRQERAVEEGLMKGEYENVSKGMFAAIAEAVAARKKDAILNIRMNGRDLAGLKQKARRLGIKYQTFISEILHRIAQAH